MKKKNWTKYREKVEEVDEEQVAMMGQAYELMDGCANAK